MTNSPLGPAGILPGLYASAAVPDGGDLAGTSRESSSGHGESAATWVVFCLVVCR